MTEKGWRNLRRTFLWIAVAACVIGLIAGAGKWSWPGIAALAIFGGCAATIAVFEHGWHRVPIGLSALTCAIILLGLVWIPMAALGWWAWPKPAQVVISPPARGPKAAPPPIPEPHQVPPLPGPLKPLPEPNSAASGPEKPLTPPATDALIEQAFTAVQHCYLFQQQSEERRNAALREIKKYDDTPDVPAKNKRQYARRMEGIALEEDETQYAHSYRDEFTRAIQGLLSAGAREYSPGLSFQHAGYGGAASYFCSDLRGTTWSLVDLQFHKKEISVAEVRQYIARLRHIERMYPTPPPPPSQPPQ